MSERQAPLQRLKENHLKNSTLLDSKVFDGKFGSVPFVELSVCSVYARQLEGIWDHRR